MDRNNASQGPVPSDSHQPACPAFTRWMQRRILKSGSSSTKACRTGKKSSARGIPYPPESSMPATHASSIASVSSNTAIHPVLTPPNEEELTVAHLQELKQRLQCRQPFLNAFLQQLLEDPKISAAWITPLPRTETAMGLCVPASRLGQQTVIGSVAPWVKPIDDIWRVAVKAARDGRIANHERELAFVVTLVKPLLDATAFPFGLKSQDLEIASCIQRARCECSDQSTVPMSSEADDALLGQASLLKALLIPRAIDFEADCINPIQYYRVNKVVEQALAALELMWDEPEAVKPLGQTRLQPMRYPKGESGHAQ